MKATPANNPTATATAFAGVALILGLLFDLLFYGKIPGISFPIYIAAITLGLIALSRHFKRPLSKTALWLLVPAGFFAAMVAIRASELLTFLNICAALILMLFVAHLAFRGHLRSFNLRDYLKMPFLPFKFFAPLTRTISDVFAFSSTVKSHPLAAQITRGVLLALPVLIVFIILFSSADMVFEKYVLDAFDINLNQDTIKRIVLVILVTLLFTGAYSYSFRRTDQEPDAPATEPAFKIGNVESSILLGSVSALFFLFILVQLAYLFGGATNISVQGFTYAEYARKGFFELVAVALVAFALIWAADKTVTKTKQGHSLVFRLLSSFLIAEVILIIVSAFKRLYLYEQAYGFTTLRLFSHVFVIFLAIIFILLLIKILKNQAENRFAFPAFIAAILFLAGMNLLNPDAFIARQNIDRFHETGKLDAFYLSGLSADADAEINEAIGITSGETQQELKSSQKTDDPPTDWQSWNLSRNRP